MRSVSAKSGSGATRADPGVRPTAEAAPPLPGWLQMVVLGIAATCLLGFFSTEADDTDFWWHLKTGQYIVQQHALPVPDPFAYTTAMNPPSYPGEEQLRHFNLTHEWLAQAMMYGVYSIGGLPAVILARAGLLAALCGLVGFLAARRTGKFYAGVAAAFATASVATWVAVDRPMIVTFLFVAVFIAVLESRRGLWFLPALALIWANCHGGFFLGWVVLLIYCAAEWRRLWLVTACAIAVSALNPNGFGVISTLFRYRQSAMTGSLVEWHRPYLWGSPYAFDLLLYAAALALILSWRKVRLADWLLFAAFAGAALLAFRNILLIGLLAPILIATYFPFRFRLPRAAAWAVPPLLVGVLVTGILRGSFFQLHGAMWKFPVGAADYLLANHVPGPLFNTYEHGGYLIWRLWPQYKVFIDGRSLSETLYKDYQQILSNPNSDAEQVTGPRADLLQRYGIQTVVMNTFEFNRGGAYTLALALGNPATTDWQLVYDDAQSLVFLHRPPAGTPVFADKLPHVVDHLERECTANIEHSPVTYLCARTLADLWMRAGDTPRARRMLQLYLQHTMYRDPEAEELLRQLR
ncbi:MAG TPA: hypothetical protein VEU96_24375 [Bryobacteraceae bacterium]|nr:hypothetical protein [Bryobacteraceae bacterium]